MNPPIDAPARKLALGAMNCNTENGNGTFLLALSAFETTEYYFEYYWPVGKRLVHMDRRKHGRVQMRLPVRIRWLSPFRLQEEVQQTEDVSRGGLKISISVSAVAGTHVWVTYPYDSSVPEGQPEMLVRIVRCHPRAGGGATLAGKYETLVSLTGAAEYGRTFLAERRASRRWPVAMRVRVRPEHLPWFDEVMTLDFSDEGLRFLSCREYEPGTPVVVVCGGTSAGPWQARGEFPAIVARAVEAQGSSELDISVSRLGVRTERVMRNLVANVLRVS